MPLWAGSPYPGLRTFTSDQAPIFFGRSREIDLLAAQVRGNRFVAVVGASGSGKSSLVRAGLLPRLRETSDTAGWISILLRPTTEESDDPFIALAAALASALPEAQRPRAKDLAVQLACDSDALSRTTAQVLSVAAETDELFLVIAQFEELFRLAKANEFITLLNRAASLPRCRILVTMRADFYEMASSYPFIAQQLSTGNFTLAAPRPEALAQIIRGPAQRAGVHVPDELLAALMADTSAVVALPLVAFVLSEMWDCRSGNVMTLESYQNLGRIQGAIEKRAQRLHIDAGQEAALPNLFSALVRIGVDGMSTRQRASRADPAENPSRYTLEETLINVRFLVACDQGESHIEFAHEALLTGWPLLSQWIDRNRTRLLLREDLFIDVQRWLNADRDNALLLSRGPRLLAAQVLLREDLYLLDEDTRRYVELSILRQNKLSLYDAIRYRAFQEYTRPFLLERMKLLENQSQSPTYGGAKYVATSELKLVRQLLGEFGKWHPEEPTEVGNTGPIGDYETVWRFPCCGSVSVGDNKPSQFRDDGCQDPPS